MAKTKSKKRRGGGTTKQGGGGGGGVGNWSNAEHEDRTAKRIASMNKRHRRRELERMRAEDEAAEAEEANNAVAGPGVGADADADRLRVDERPAAEEKRLKKQKQHIQHERPVHQLRPTKKNKPHRSDLASHVPENSYKRSHLAHDNLDSMDSTRLRLATAAVRRKVDALRNRLENWDPLVEKEVEAEVEAEARKEDTSSSLSLSSVERRMQIEAAYRQGDREAVKKAQHEYVLLHAKHGVNSSLHRRKANLKKRPRPGPETWKLRGAARPAWEVYDFDTRYVDVHVKALEEANAKARRSKNVLALCRGRFALMDEDDDNEGEGNGDGNDKGESSKKQLPNKFPPPQPHCRNFLSLLTQLGSLHLERKNYSSARAAFLEAIELEGPHRPSSITNARSQLMCMYLSTNRPSSARKLWTSLAEDDGAWVRYSAALMEYVSWNLLGEGGSSADVAERALARAIRGNVYVAYLLAWPETFRRAMEYTDEVAEDGAMASEGGSILEAIEYGCCCYSNGGGGGDDGGGNVDTGDDRGMALWLGTEGSLDWVRSAILRALKDEGAVTRDAANEDDAPGGGGRLTRADMLGWEAKLKAEEEGFEREREERERARSDGEYRRQRSDDDGDGDGDSGGVGNDEGEENDEEDRPDVVMYGGMFRTAMDWLQDAGEFLKEPSFEYLQETAAAGDDDEMGGNDDKEVAGGGEDDGNDDRDGGEQRGGIDQVEEEDDDGTDSSSSGTDSSDEP